MNIQALANLDSFTGTENYYRMGMGGFMSSCVMTDGAKFLADNADCYWLFDAIFSAQLRPEIRNDDMLRNLQFWTLKKDGNGGATLVCERDSDDVAWKQEVEMTDFPFDAVAEVKVWVAPTSLEEGKRVLVAYLPSEH